MPKDESRRQKLRDTLSFKTKEEKRRQDLSIPGSSNASINPSTQSVIGDIRSSDYPATTGSALAVVPVPSRVKENIDLKHTRDQEDRREVSSRRLSQSIASESAADEHSLWALAYKGLRKAKPELVQKFDFCLGISTGVTNGQDFVSPSINEVAQEALKALKEADDSREKLSRLSAKIRKHFEQAVKIIIASKDFISSAVSTNPYAALAWTGVSLLLPLLLNPSQENEAAVEGLDCIANLMIVYKWQEKVYLQVSDFKDSAIRLYTAILEYEATLLVHLRQNPPKRWVRNVFQAGDWSRRMDSIRQQDANCRDVTNAIAATRAKEWRDEERQWHDKLLQQLCQDGYEERRNIRMLYSNYEADKNVNPERIMGTCEWFLSHTSFLTWRESQCSNIVWLSADPGCGKSVLAKHLVDRKGEVLTVNSETPTLCYFFFRDGDKDRMDGAKALCAFLHQIIMQRPCLYQHAKEDFRNKNEKFLDDFDALWNIFLKAAEDPSCREIICVLDALDECQENSRKTLIAKLVQLYSLRGSTRNGKPILKFLVTSRPDFHIIRSFKELTENLSEVRLRGEQESEQISREINLVIDHQVKELGSQMDLSESDQSHLRKNLSNKPHRTYLWLHLTLSAIQKKLEFTKDEIAVIAKTIPEDVDHAYTDILRRSPDPQRARKLLHIVLAATRPLTLQEANVAVVMEERDQSYKDLDLWQPNVSEDRIKNICGLFLSVVDSKVYLMHQTAREFLVCEENQDSCSELQSSPSEQWKNSFDSAQSNLLLAKICIWYLQLRDFRGTGKPAVESIDDEEPVDDEESIDNKEPTDDEEPIGDEDPTDDEEEHYRYAKQYQFLSYAAKNWAEHFAYVQDLAEPSLVEAVAYRICNTLSQSFKIWSSLFWESNMYLPIPSRITNILVVSFLGHDAVIKLLLGREDVGVDLPDESGRTPLSWAAYLGHEAIVKLLLERKDVRADSPDRYGQTPLSRAAGEGHKKIVELLLEREDVRVDLPDEDGRTPLVCAAVFGREAVVKLLLKRKDVQAESQDRSGQTPLRWAERNKHETVIRLLK